LEKSGHSFIFAKMIREKAPLGGESSGHFFLPGGFPGDALFACLRVLEILKSSQKSLSDYFDQFPPRVSTHDLKLVLSAEVIEKLYEDLKTRARAMGGVVTTLDGVRAVFEGGWGIVRKSVTQPCLSCRFESSDKKKIAALIAEWFQDNPEIQEMVLEKI